MIHEQSLPTFDEDYNFISYYNWTGTGTSLSPLVNNHGNGEPKAYTGLVGTHHRPSDDLSIFRKSDLIGRTAVFLFPQTAFLTPANAMLSVELGSLADVLDSVGQLGDVRMNARKWSETIKGAIWKTTVSLDKG